MLCDPAGLWQQVHFTMTKHAHRASNLANEDVNLFGTSIKHGAFSCGCLMLQLLNLRVKASVSLVKH